MGTKTPTDPPGNKPQPPDWPPTLPATEAELRIANIAFAKGVQAVILLVDNREWLHNQGFGYPTWDLSKVLERYYADTLKLLRNKST